MSFFHIPISTSPFQYAQQAQQQQPTIPRQFSYPTEYFVNNSNNVPPLSYLISPSSQQTKPVERNVPFKVYIFEGKFNHNLNSASNVLRFEINANHSASFELFDRVLREHCIDMKQYELHYVDDENDLVSLSTSRDFQFMLKLMKGKLIKIVCEKKSYKPQQLPQPQFVQIQRVSQPSTQPKPSTCPFAQFQQARGVESQKKQSPQQSSIEQSWENMIEKAFRSAFLNDERPIQPKQSFFPHVSSTAAASNSTPQAKSQPKVRRIEINLADLLGIPTTSSEQEQSKKEEAKKQEKKHSTSSPQSFRELLLQRMKELIEEEAKIQQAQQTQEKKQEEEKQVETSPTPQEANQEEEPIQESAQESLKEQQVETTQNISTSLLLSNLIEDQSTESVNQKQLEQESIVNDQVEQEESEPSNQEDNLSNQELENQDPIIESIPEEPIVKTSIPHKYQKELKLLNDMGFSNHILNITLLNKYEGDIQRTISHLIHQ